MSNHYYSKETTAVPEQELPVEVSVGKLETITILIELRKLADNTVRDNGTDFGII